MDTITNCFYCNKEIQRSKRYNNDNKYYCKKCRGLSRRGWSREDLVDAVKKYYTYSDVCRQLGLKPKPGNFITIKKYMEICVK